MQLSLSKNLEIIKNWFLAFYIIWYLGCHPETHLSFAFTDLVFSTDDECKLPPHSREANKYPKHKTYSKNRRNGTVVVNSVCKSVCIREDFLSTKN